MGPNSGNQVVRKKEKKRAKKPQNADTFCVIKCTSHKIQVSSMTRKGQNESALLQISNKVFIVHRLSKTSSEKRVKSWTEKFHYSL